MFKSLTDSWHCQCLMGGLLDAESADECSWLLTSFVESFGQAPQIIFSDEGAGIGCAIRQLKQDGAVLENTLHFLCVWHMSCRVRKNCKSVFRSNASGWNSFFSAFWQVARDSEAGFGDTDAKFAEDMARLRQMIDDTDGDDHKKITAFDHIEKLQLLGHQWAACYTHGHCTYGARTTQRCEGNI